MNLPFTSPRDLPFPAQSTALLFVDMQRAWVTPGLDPHLTTSEATYFYSRLQERVIPNQIRLLSAFRERGADVLHTIIESLTADGRDRSLDHKLSDMHLPKGIPMPRSSRRLHQLIMRSSCPRHPLAFSIPPPSTTSSRISAFSAW